MATGTNFKPDKNYHKGCYIRDKFGMLIAVMIILFLIFIYINVEKISAQPEISVIELEDDVVEDEIVECASAESVQYSASVEMPELTVEDFEKILEQELIDMGYYRTDVPLSYELQDALHIYCDTFGVDYNLVLGLIKLESSFDSTAVSSAGCYGLMQLHPTYFPTNLSDSDNLYYGVKYLSECIERYDGDIMAGLRAYNRGYDDGARGYSKTVIEYAKEFGY